MALSCDFYGKEKQDEYKDHFFAREGLYKLMSFHEYYSKPKQTQAVNNNTGNTPVRVSFMNPIPNYSGQSDTDTSSPTHNQNSVNNHVTSSEFEAERPNGYHYEEKMCYNFGKELYVYPYNSRLLNQDQPAPLDKRIYKNTFPTCHDFNQFSPRPESVFLLVGFTGGQIQLIDPIRKEQSKLFNEERLIDKTPVTCIKWVPDSPNQFLVSHASGQLYLYNEDLPSGATVPTYQIFKQGTGFSVYTCKTKSTRNPLYRWILGGGGGGGGSSSGGSGGGTLGPLGDPLPAHYHTLPTGRSAANPGSLLSSMTGGSMQISPAAAINQFAFSPCGQYLAAVSQDGYLRVFDYHQMELQGSMRSYFGGLLCVSWSPDSRFLSIGGQDDLVTIWSVQDRAVVCRGQGHKSWVNVVRFDAHLCPGGDGICCNANDDLNSGSSPEPVSCHGNNTDSEEEEAQLILRKCGGRRTQSRLCRNSCATSTGSDDQLSSSTKKNCANTYRLGSVGQDTLLCLWELTEDVVRQGLRSAAIGYSGDSTSSLAFTGSNHHTVVTDSGDHSLDYVETTTPSPVTNNNGVGTTSKPTTKRTKSEGGSTLSQRLASLTLGASRATGSSPNSSSRDSGVNSLSGGHKRLLSLSGGGKNSLGRHSTLGTRSPSEGTGAWNGLGSSIADIEERILGTSVCPRLDDVPILEPLLSKQVSQDRLTDLVFRPESIVIACQQGTVYTFGRPGNNIPSPPCLSPGETSSSPPPEASLPGPLSPILPPSSSAPLYTMPGGSVSSPSFSPTSQTLASPPISLDALSNPGGTSSWKQQPATGLRSAQPNTDGTVV